MRGGAQGGCQLWAATLQLRCPENRARAQWISPDIAGRTIACSFLILFRNEYLNTYLKQNEIEILNFLEPRRWHHVGVGFDSGSLKMKHCGKNMCIERNCCTCCRIKQGWELAMQQATHKNCTVTVTTLFLVEISFAAQRTLQPQSVNQITNYMMYYMYWCIICTYMKLNVININFGIYKVLTVLLCVLAWSRLRLFDLACNATSNAPTQRGCHGHSGWPRWPHRPGGWLKWHGAWRTWVAEETTGANIWSLQTSSVLAWSIYLLLWSVVDLEWNIYHSFKWKVLPNHEIFGPMADAGCKGVRYSLPFRTSGCSMPLAVLHKSSFAFVC